MSTSALATVIAGSAQRRLRDRLTDGVGPRVFFQRVPEGRRTKDRLHPDVRAAPGLASEERVAAPAAEADRLTALVWVHVVLPPGSRTS